MACLGRCWRACVPGDETWWPRWAVSSSIASRRSAGSSTSLASMRLRGCRSPSVSSRCLSLRRSLVHWSRMTSWLSGHRPGRLVFDRPMSTLLLAGLSMSLRALGVCDRMCLWRLASRMRTRWGARGRSRDEWPARVHTCLCCHSTAASRRTSHCQTADASFAWPKTLLWKGACGLLASPLTHAAASFAAISTDA